MLSSLYIFFCSVTLVLFFISFYDWGINKQKIAGVISCLSFVMSAMMFAFSWSIKTVSNGVEVAATYGWESYAISSVWFLFAVISSVLTLVIYLESPKELNAK